MSKSTSNAQKRIDIDDAQSDDQSTTTTREPVTINDLRAGDRVVIEYNSAYSDDRQEIAGEVTSAKETPPYVTVDALEETADGDPIVYEVVNNCVSRLGSGRISDRFDANIEITAEDDTDDTGTDADTICSDGGSSRGDYRGLGDSTQSHRPEDDAVIMTDGGVAVKGSPAPDTQQTDDGQSSTGKYGIPTATMNRARRHLGDNPVAQLDLQDRLFDAPITERALSQRDPMPDDPVGVYYDVRTGRIVDVGENKHGWLITRDHETHEPDVFDPGRVRPAINDRRLLPVSATGKEVQG